MHWYYLWPRSKKRKRNLQMARMVMCVKLGKELPALKYAPIKGELGQRIYENVSEEGWRLWLKHSTMVINEYRLNPSEPEAQRVLSEHLERFFFGDGAALPEGYVPPSHNDDSSDKGCG
jgi:Fe-S cluster biosynthesis and repair protein YggX